MTTDVIWPCIDCTFLLLLGWYYESKRKKNECQVNKNHSEKKPPKPEKKEVLFFNIWFISGSLRNFHLWGCCSLTLQSCAQGGSKASSPYRLLNTCFLRGAYRRKISGSCFWRAISPEDLRVVFFKCWLWIFCIFGLGIDCSIPDQ